MTLSLGKPGESQILGLAAPWCDEWTPAKTKVVPIYAHIKPKTKVSNNIIAPNAPTWDCSRPEISILNKIFWLILKNLKYEHCVRFFVPYQYALWKVRATPSTLIKGIHTSLLRKGHLSTWNTFERAKYFKRWCRLHLGYKHFQKRLIIPFLVQILVWLDKVNLTVSKYLNTSTARRESVCTKYWESFGQFLILCRLSYSLGLTRETQVLRAHIATPYNGKGFYWSCSSSGWSSWRWYLEYSRLTKKFQNIFVDLLQPSMVRTQVTPIVCGLLRLILTFSIKLWLTYISVPHHICKQCRREGKTKALQIMLQ